MGTLRFEPKSRFFYFIPQVYDYDSRLHNEEVEEGR